MRVIPREKKEKLIPDILIKYQSLLKFSCQLVAIYFLIINEDQPSVYTLNKEDRQDSCRSWKTLKVMEFLFLISSPGKSWNLIEGHGKAICFPSSQGKETKGNCLSRWYHEKLRNFSAKIWKKCYWMRKMASSRKIFWHFRHANLFMFILCTGNTVSNSIWNQFAQVSFSKS